MCAAILVACPHLLYMPAPALPTGVPYRRRRPACLPGREGEDTCLYLPYLFGCLVSIFPHPTCSTAFSPFLPLFLCVSFGTPYFLVHAIRLGWILLGFVIYPPLYLPVDFWALLTLAFVPPHLYLPLPTIQGQGLVLLPTYSGPQDISQGCAHCACVVGLLLPVWFSLPALCALPRFPPHILPSATFPGCLLLCACPYLHPVTSQELPACALQHSCWLHTPYMPVYPSFTLGILDLPHRVFPFLPSFPLTLPCSLVFWCGVPLIPTPLPLLLPGFP